MSTLPRWVSAPSRLPRRRGPSAGPRYRKLRTHLARAPAASAPGHRVAGDRSQRSRDSMSESTRVGYTFAHAIVDDHMRLAFVELHEDETAAT
jgi:hypothetical protein